MKKDSSYKHIIDGIVVNDVDRDHLLSTNSVSDFNYKNNKKKYENILKNYFLNLQNKGIISNFIFSRNNKVKFYIPKLDINLVCYIRFLSTGGTTNEKSGSKKCSIPFDNKEFILDIISKDSDLNHPSAKKYVCVLGTYLTMKSSNNKDEFELNDELFLFLMNPNLIFEAKAMTDRSSNNSTNRWIKLDLVNDLVNNNYNYEKSNDDFFAFTYKKNIVEALLEVDYLKEYSDLKNKYLKSPYASVVLETGTTDEESAVSTANEVNENLVDLNLDEIISSTFDDYSDEEFYELNFLSPEEYNELTQKKIKQGHELIRDRELIDKFRQSEFYGTCYLCNTKETFVNHEGKQYFETHHIIPYNENVQINFFKNLDSFINLVCLCSECHRKIHLGNKETRNNLILKLFKKIKDNGAIKNHYPELDSVEKLIKIYKETFNLSD